MSNSQDYSPAHNHTPDPQQDQTHLYAHGHLHLTNRTKAVIMPLSLALLIAGWIIYWLFPSQLFMADIYGLVLAALCGLPIIIGALKELASGRAGLSLLVALAVIGAVAIGDYLEAGTVAFILQLAILVEELAERAPGSEFGPELGDRGVPIKEAAGLVAPQHRSGQRFAHREHPEQGLGVQCAACDVEDTLAVFEHGEGGA